MFRATTPTHVFTLPEDTASYTEIQVTYSQENTVLVKHYQDETLPSGMTLEGSKVYIRLTQEETLGFKPGNGVRVQVRVMDANNNVMASQKYPVTISTCLSEDILA